MRLFFISLFLISLSASPLSIFRSFLQENECIQSRFYQPFKNSISEVLSLEQNQTDSALRLNLARDLALLISGLPQIKKDCGLDLDLQNLKDDWLQSAGYLFLTASNCFKDVGAELLILDQLLADIKEKNIQESLLTSIFLAVLGYQGFNDCKPLFSFFGIKHNPKILGVPHTETLGGCSIWGITGCGAAVTAAAVACGGPVDPLTAACIAGALSALPTCGVCLCQAFNCPNHCPCS